MIVDGTNAANSVSSPPQPSKGLDGRAAVRGTRRENQLAATARAQDSSRLAIATRDSYEHVETPEATPVTYSGPAAPQPTGPAVDTGQDGSGGAPDYTAEIVDLETAVNAKGLPLLPEANGQGVFSQEVLSAYEAARGQTAPPPETPGSPTDHINSLG